MPAKSGVSHAFAALVALLLSPYLKAFVQSIVSQQDVILAIERAAQQAAAQPEIPFSTDITTLVLYLGVIFILVFIWGYTYHYSRHGS